jgi:integrase
MYKPTLSLHDQKGQRKYLNQTERLQFLKCTINRPLEVRLFCQLLFFTGARIAEIHNLTNINIDFSNGSVVIETLKKRKRGIYREILLLDHVLSDLKCLISQFENESENPQSLWSFCLRTGARHVKRIMVEAGIFGTRSCARGLRHSLAVQITSITRITEAKKWLGHASIETTAIYLDVVGEEERAIAQKIWAKDLMGIENVTQLQTSA